MQEGLSLTAQVHKLTRGLYTLPVSYFAFENRGRETAADSTLRLQKFFRGKDDGGMRSAAEQRLENENVEQWSAEWIDYWQVEMQEISNRGLALRHGLGPNGHLLHRPQARRAPVPCVRPLFHTAVIVLYLQNSVKQRAVPGPFPSVWQPRAFSEFRLAILSERPDEMTVLLVLSVCSTSAT